MSKISRDYHPLAVVSETKAGAPMRQLASEVKEMATRVRDLMAGGLTEEAIIVLVKNAIPDSYGISEKSVKTVLFVGLTNLEKKYLKSS